MNCLTIALGTGEGVNVYIIDTGIRTTHEDFEGRAKIAYDVYGDEVRYLFDNSFLEKITRKHRV